jgi:dihydroorotate dehydrogenase
VADLYPALLRATGRFDPETIHRGAVWLARFAGAVAPIGWLAERLWRPPDDPVTVLGIRFRNRVGLAAGFDKDGAAHRGLARLGFGHIEVGTVTPQAQPGNPRPRIRRLDGDGAIVNSMGFPGKGAGYVERRLRRRHRDVVLGVNIGKQATTPVEDAARDYLFLLERFAALADYLVVNVSSPNTPGLRALQGEDTLGDLLRRLVQRRSEIGSGTPLLIKLSPDLSEGDLSAALEITVAEGGDGVIATNTTISRPPLESRGPIPPGGLSGRPLHPLSLRMIGLIREKVGSTLPVIASGGVMDGDSARALVDAGADLVQVYTGLVFRGPAIVKEIVSGIRPVTAG